MARSDAGAQSPARRTNAEPPDEWSALECSSKHISPEDSLIRELDRALVHEVIRRAPGSSQRELMALTRLPKARLLTVLELGVSEGWVRVLPGPRRSLKHYVDGGVDLDLAEWALQVMELYVQGGGRLPAQLRRRMRDVLILVAELGD